MYTSIYVYFIFFFFFFKQKTAYEMLSGDWSSDVCSSDLHELPPQGLIDPAAVVLLHRHGDPIPGPDVVQQVVSERMKHLVAERGRHHERAAIDRAAGW